MKTSSNAASWYACVLCVVALIESYPLGYMVALAVFGSPSALVISRALPGFLLLAVSFLMTLGCLVFEFRLLREQRNGLLISAKSAAAAFWVGLIPLVLLFGSFFYSMHR